MPRWLGHRAWAFAGVADFDPNTSPKAKFNLTSAGLSDVFVAKYGSSLQFVWARRIGGAGDDVGNSIARDFFGNIYVTGNFTGNNVDFNPGAGVNFLSDAGTGDVFVLKLNSLGQFTWARRLGGTSALREDAAGPRRGQLRQCLCHRPFP